MCQKSQEKNEKFLNNFQIFKIATNAIFLGDKKENEEQRPFKARFCRLANNFEHKLHNGNEYDKEILNGVFEHLAIVKTPRYEDAYIAVNAIVIKDNKEGEPYHVELDDKEEKEYNKKLNDWQKTIDYGKMPQEHKIDKTMHPKFGKSYPEYSHKPKEAIEHLLNVQKGYVPAAIYKEGVGDIDFVYGESGKKGFGLAHIIERRNSESYNGKEFVKSLPEIIKNGEVITKEKHADRKYITDNKNEVTIRLDYDGEKRNWLVTAYVLTNKELSK